MEKKKINREEALARLEAAREKKRECIARLRKSMKEAYRKRTGEDAKSFFAL